MTDVLHFWLMGTTLTIRLRQDLALWLQEQSRATGRSQSSLVKEALDKARGAKPAKPFLKLAGSLEGDSGFSRRKGFARQ